MHFQLKNSISETEETQPFFSAYAFGFFLKLGGDLKSIQLCPVKVGD
jgi:hypothetical protein